MRLNASSSAPRPWAVSLGYVAVVVAFLAGACGAPPPPDDDASVTLETATSSPPPAETSPVTLTHLEPGERVRSRDGAYVLVHQTDGNAVLYGPSGPVWATHTAGRATGLLAFQADGNFVLYAADRATPIWSTHTTSRGDLLAVQGDSNLVIYGADHATPVWAIRGLTPPTPPRDVRGSTADGCGGWRHTVLHHFGSGELARACRVLVCESKGEPHAHNPTSSASGLWQFLDGTWTRTTGLAPEARDYSPDTQTHAAKRLRDRAGWSQWSCR